MLLSQIAQWWVTQGLSSQGYNQMLVLITQSFYHNLQSQGYQNIPSIDQLLKTLQTYDRGFLDPNKQKIHYAKAIHSISIVDDSERYEYAMSVLASTPLFEKSKLPALWNGLSPSQQQAIRDAHDKHGELPHPLLLSDTQKRDKIHILINWWFTHTQALLLLYTFVCWKWTIAIVIFFLLAGIAGGIYLTNLRYSKNQYNPPVLTPEQIEQINSKSPQDTLPTFDENAFRETLSQRGKSFIETGSVWLNFNFKYIMYEKYMLQALADKSWCSILPIYGSFPVNVSRGYSLEDLQQNASFTLNPEQKTLQVNMLLPFYKIQDIKYPDKDWWYKAKQEWKCDVFNNAEIKLASVIALEDAHKYFEEIFLPQYMNQYVWKRAEEWALAIWDLIQWAAGSAIENGKCEIIIRFDFQVTASDRGESEQKKMIQEYTQLHTRFPIVEWNIAVWWNIVFEG